MNTLRRIPTVLGIALACMQTIPAGAQSYVPEQHAAFFARRESVPIRAYAFPLQAVRLLDSPFREAMKRDTEYLLSLEPDRLLARFRAHAGLPPKAEIYGGWESLGISGHSLGHYLSACALAYASTGDGRFKQRVDYIVKALAECQRARGTGYVGAIPKEDSVFAEVRQGHIHSAGFDLNGAWVPWYTVHKVFAGLLDAYEYAGNKEAKAVVIRLADWVEATTAGLTDAQMQEMLRCEHGGMNEALADVYALTGEARYRKLALRFNHTAVLQPLMAGRDELAGKHANTQIPKVLGLAREYEMGMGDSARKGAAFFWKTVTQQHSYVIGGNSDHEHFGPAGKLADRLSPQSTETCNSYNMLKLTRHLFAWQPKAPYFDYYERTLYNHILASQNTDGMMCYYVSLLPGDRKVYNTPTESFWCCTGTGMENHVKYGEGIYAHTAEGSLFVNLYLPSRLDWKERGLVLVQQTRAIGSDTVQMVLETAPKDILTLKLRKPAWADKVQIRVNGALTAVQTDGDGYMNLSRLWRKGDRILLILPTKLYREALPDDARKGAFLYGPWVLAADLGIGRKDSLAEVPVLVSAKGQLLKHLSIGSKALGHFKTERLGHPHDLRLVPFYQIRGADRYAIYLEAYTPGDWVQRRADRARTLATQAELARRTTDLLRIGEMQPERDHDLTAENSTTGDNMGHKWRHADNGGFIAFDMKADPAAEQELILTYWGSDGGNRAFEIWADSTKIAEEVLEAPKPGQFFDKAYRLPRGLTEGKTKLHIRLQALPGKTAGGFYGVRLVRRP